MRKQVSGADHLYSLLNAPWLQSLLKIYECLQLHLSNSPEPYLTYASGLSHQMMVDLQGLANPSTEATELYRLLRNPHLQALLSSHDMVAQKDFNPVLPPLPDDLPNEEEAMRIVCLVKNNQPLGATIKKNEVTGEIFVARVIHGGLADRSGLLNMGDKLVEVNWQPVAGMDPEQIIEILTQSQGTIMFKLVPMSDKPVNTPVKLYMRAMVDYCPQHDPAIPCADAGVVFHKGNVLEVVDQTDALWWQARKLPSTSAFAGLIPSAELLKRKQKDFWWSPPLLTQTCIEICEWKIVMRKLLNLVAGFRRSLRLCRRKLASLLHQSRDNHYPSSSHSALTHPYEEVVLYQRRMQDKHRLVVLVGSSGVGVNELRRRLIERQPKIFQGPVPHTTRPPKSYEEPGREYHFIKNEQFENMADTQRFLEYAEYKGHLYGTSFDGIRDVLDKGMICIVDIEPHAIPSIRTQEFRPYIIFVKPPSCARMRKTRKNAQIITNYFVNRPFKEEDFQEIEEAAKKMEAQYGHFFDHVLVNDGLQDSCEQLLWVTRRAQDDPQWVPAAWLQPTGQS
ncbi:MAGUK p55 subfamily member 4-like [Scleropages formosus]|uniref:MAGUK p55 subfamily member 4-like n=1 Tax=Scleropages formosus TaxID=113540 RepID=A0A0N8K344_SCLFO|nr:MAGUK p55 subfamily member 4-like [Scleropages formosus]